MGWGQIAEKVILTNVPNYYISDENCENLYYKAMANQIDRVFISPTSAAVGKKFKDRGVKTAVSIAYPAGCADPELKAMEIKNCENEGGAADMYFVTAAVGYFMSGHEDNLQKEMTQCVEAVNKPVYFIIEAGEMSDRHLRILCNIAKKTKAAGIISSTAFMPYEICREPAEDARRLRQYADGSLEIIVSGAFAAIEEIEHVIVNGADTVIINESSKIVRV